MRGSRERILPVLLLAAFSAFGGTYPTSSFTLSAGINSFSSPAENQRDGNSGLFGRVEYLHRIGIPIGASLSLGYDLCPICDNRGGEYVAAYSMVGQFIPMEFPFQLLAGIGYANGNDPRRGGAKGAFAGINIPLIARLVYRYAFAGAFLAAGAEVSLQWNNRNNVLALALPIQWGIR